MTHLQYLVSGLEQPSFSSDDSDSISARNTGASNDFAASPLKAVNPGNAQNTGATNSALRYGAGFSGDIRQPAAHTKTHTPTKLAGISSTSRDIIGKSASKILNILKSALKSSYYAFLGAWQGLLGGALAGAVTGAILPSALLNDYLPDVALYPLTTVGTAAGLTLGSVVGTVAGTAIGAYNGATNGPKELIDVEQLLDPYRTNLN